MRPDHFYRASGGRCILFALAFALTYAVGCVPPTTVGTSSGYQRFSPDVLKEVHEDELRDLQFFTSGTLRLESDQKDADDSLATEQGKLMKIQTRQYRTVEIPARTPGVLVELGNDWLDLDVGDGVVLRFRATGDKGEYQCVAFNSQPVAAENTTTADAKAPTVDFDGEKYNVVSTRPVFLEYFMRRVVNVDRANQTIGGKRLDDPAKTAAK